VTAARDHLGHQAEGPVGGLDAGVQVEEAVQHAANEHLPHERRLTPEA
jgi:hypothetical protein